MDTAIQTITRREEDIEDEERIIELEVEEEDRLGATDQICDEVDVVEKKRAEVMRRKTRQTSKR